MSHPEQLAFIGYARSLASSEVTLGKVLEVGSFDVNGTIRQIIGECQEHVGADLVSGPGVDVVKSGHLLEFADGYFDLTFSSECFEHDAHWAESFVNMVRMTKPGGAVVFSCASKRHPEHGTMRSSPRLSSGTQAIGSDYYRNLEASDFEHTLDMNTLFSDYRFYYRPVTWDLYFIGWVSDGKEDVHPVLPSAEEINLVTVITPLVHRLARTPLYVLLKLIPVRVYNQLVNRYWRLLEKVGNSLFQGRFMRFDKNFY